MADPNDDVELPQAMPVAPKRSRLSIVWIIPVLAVLVGIGIAVQRIRSEGPTITIVFKAAEGIEAGKTFIKYKDVIIGQVKTVQFTEDYANVEVTAKVDEIARETPGVANIGSYAGQSVLLNAFASNYGTMFVVLEPFHDRRGSSLTASAQLTSVLRDPCVFGSPVVKLWRRLRWERLGRRPSRARGPICVGVDRPLPTAV